MKALKVTASSLNVRSVPAGVVRGELKRDDIVAAHGVSYDGGWIYVVGPNGLMGWASVQFLIDAPLSKPVPASTAETQPKPPTGLAGIKAAFGEPGNPECTAGIVNLPGELKLSFQPATKIKRFACHRKVAQWLQAAFDEIHREGLWSLLEDFGGCFNMRTARGLTKLSTHSWGIAIDINVRTNPLGAKPVLDKRIVTIFEKHGFTWGGRWGRPDGMHFQFAKGY